MVFDYDAELRRYAGRLTEAVAVGPDDHVLDIGCGAGKTTRDAAQRAVRGSALGLDISPVMVAEARALSDGLTNVRFEEADAQVHPFTPGRFTLAFSRFGTMFFADPVAAFTNIGRALAPGSRLVQLVWQAAEHQEWVAAVRRALGPSEAGTRAFSMADPSTVDAVLTAAGFTDITRTELAEPVWYGPDPASATEAVRALRMISEPLAAADAGALDRLRAIMDANATADGVWFDSRAWLISATI
jgi:SAM-dependent methyltransferase